MEETLIYPLPTRAWLDVSVAAMRRNAAWIRRRTGLPLIPMVKANGYGIGITGVPGVLEPLEPLAYGVASVHEGEQLRAAGVRRPVVVFSPVLEVDYARAHAAGLTLALGSAGAISAWAGGGNPYHLVIDTGMSRAGVMWRDVASIREVVRRYPPAAAFTHFHSAQVVDGLAEEQEMRFLGALAELGVSVPFIHADNSAAALRGLGGAGAPDALAAGGYRWGAVRVGIFLYGAGTSSGMNPEPVVSLRSRVVDLRWIDAGDTVSYDATCSVERRTRIATAAIGYGDGYPRSLSNRAVAALNGRRVHQRGLVTMDMTMFDVTDVPCEVGDVVSLICTDAGEELTVNGVAESAGMSPYELLTGLAERLDRRFNDE